MLAANGKTVQITPSALTKQGLATSLFPGPRAQAVALASYVKAKSEPKVSTKLGFGFGFGFGLGYACQPPACCTYRWRRAARSQGPTNCTYWVRVPATRVP